ncbi:hypothetical protein MNBD_GAMMA12-3315 [hydrothermal vent metagenome]|uniref:Beta-lactamase n=1 Tax=hydrothermal vent metagenome TaxID=652676 RepID=A0A3B0YCL0_9ZZZZ
MKTSNQAVLIRVFALLFAFIIFVSFTAISVAGEKCGNFESILKTMLTEAKQGMTTSQFIVGKMYLQGKCIKKDYHKARRWLGKAVEKDHTDAIFYLALLFNDANSPYKDYTKAVHWFNRASELGESHAQYYLGEAYLYGRGVKKDKRKAQQLLAQAMSLKDPRAHYQIGYMYQKGVRTGRRNYSKAFGWYAKSALMGYNNAHFKLAEFYAYGLGVRRDKVKAYAWYTIADLHGHTTGNAKKEKLVKRLSSQNLAEAQGLIQRYMKSMEYSEYQ